MKIILVALLCCLTLQVLEASPVKNSKEPYGIEAQKLASFVDDIKKLCTPGEDIKFGDLTCKCETYPHGVAWQCARKDCPSEQIEHGTAKKYSGRLLPPDYDCTVHGPHGLPMRPYSVQPKCQPGTSYKMDCNTCYCSETGIPICTLIECLHEVDVYAEDYKCQPHTSFTHPDGCNTCFCNDDGKTGGCTKMMCEKIAIPAVPMTASNKFCKPGEIVNIAGLKCQCEELPHGVSWTCEGHFEREVQTYSANQCQPGTTFKLDCNTCFCGQNGLSACTKMLCIHEPIQIKPTSSDSECTPGTTFNIDCNSCFCTDSGIAACTRMLCEEDLVEIKPSSAVIEKSKPLCTPEEVVEIAGLKCKCEEIPHGISWTCEGHFEKQIKTYSANKCTPGTTFNIDCNTCFCGETGLAACTLMECETPIQIKPASSDSECTPGTTFNIDCNSCFCTDSGIALCTRMLCEEDLVEMKPSSAVIEKSKPLCTPGEVVEIAGLKCECKEIPHGISWTCEGHFEKQIQTYSANKCTPGTTFNIDCNTCFCGETGLAACTIMMCPTMTVADIDSPEFRCEPGVPFKHPDGCNKCRCSADGQLAGCTRMFCAPKITYSTVSDVFSPDFKCEPNTAFSHPDGCNTCTCDSFGKTNGCTRMMCSFSAKSAADDIKDLPNLNTSAPDFKCTPGMRFRDDCNLCRCSDNGMAACTDMACPKM
jgi:hypothetical protein